ncbi:hypothetical protein LTR10_005198 [Elasticomyces elasticus]|nr:hypothetical protein LTR10_005198 [Elasticomyces elasticus]KAK4975937.1 hypothetical protein LTR42_003560 [Elasticomyces elasticus]
MKVEVEHVDLTGDALDTSSYRGTKDSQEDTNYQKLYDKVSPRLHPTAGGKLGQEWHAGLSDHDRAVQVLHIIPIMQRLKTDLDMCIAASIGIEMNVMKAAHNEADYYTQIQARMDSIMSRTKERRRSRNNNTKSTQSMSHRAGATQQTLPDNFVDIDTISDDSDTDAIFVSQSSSKRAARPLEHSEQSTYNERRPAQSFASPRNSMTKPSHDFSVPRDNHYRNAGQAASPSASSKPRARARPQFQTPSRRGHATQCSDPASPPTPTGRKRASDDDRQESFDVERTPPKRQLIGEAYNHSSRLTRRSGQAAPLSLDATRTPSRRARQTNTSSASPDRLPTLDDYYRLEDQFQSFLDMFKKAATNMVDLKSAFEALRQDTDRRLRHQTSSTNKALNGIYEKYQEMIDSNDQAPVVAEMRVPGGPYGGPRQTEPNGPVGDFTGLLEGAVGVAPRLPQPGDDDY